MKRRETENNEGFTLMEVLVAVAILGLAYVAVLQNFSVSLGNITRLSSYRENLMETKLSFDKEIILEADEKEYETFLEGSYYRLAIVTSEDGRYTTLKLVR